MNHPLKEKTKKIPRLHEMKGLQEGSMLDWVKKNKILFYPFVKKTKKVEKYPVECTQGRAVIFKISEKEYGWWGIGSWKALKRSQQESTILLGIVKNIVSKSKEVDIEEKEGGYLLKFEHPIFIFFWHEEEKEARGTWMKEIKFSALHISYQQEERGECCCLYGSILDFKTI